MSDDSPDDRPFVFVGGGAWPGRGPSIYTMPADYWTALRSLLAPVENDEWQAWWRIAATKPCDLFFCVGGTASKVSVTARGRFVTVRSNRAMDAARNELHEWDPGEAGAREDVDKALSALRKRFRLPPPPPLGAVHLDAPMAIDEFWEVCLAVSRPHGPADALEGAWLLTDRSPRRTDDFERHLWETLRAVVPDARVLVEASWPGDGSIDDNVLMRACSAVLQGADLWQAVVNDPAAFAEVSLAPEATALLRVADLSRQIRALRIANILLPVELLPELGASINHVELLQLRHPLGALKLSPYADDDMIFRRLDGSDVSREGWMTRLPDPKQGPTDRR